MLTRESGELVRADEVTVRGRDEPVVVWSVV